MAYLPVAWGYSQLHRLCSPPVALGVEMAKHYFTDRWLKSLTPAAPGKRREVWDTIIPGFGVRINDERDHARAGKAGRISFVLYSRYPGRRSPERRTLGRWPELSLEKARHKAAEWRSQIAKGIDPKDVEEEERWPACERRAIRLHRSRKNSSTSSKRIRSAKQPR